MLNYFWILGFVIAVCYGDYNTKDTTVNEYDTDAATIMDYGGDYDNVISKTSALNDQSEDDDDATTLRVRFQNTRVCEGQHLRLRCRRKGYVIQIRHSWYGRPKGEKSCTRGKKWGICKPRRSTRKIARRCNNRHSCRVHVTNRIVGDPCRGIYKLLFVTARCKKQARRRQKVNILTARYGKNCGAKACSGKVCSNIKKRCNGRLRCVYKIDVRVIGDPRGGCAKNYSVKYKCGNRGATKTVNMRKEAHGRTIVLDCRARKRRRRRRKRRRNVAKKPAVIKKLVGKTPVAKTSAAAAQGKILYGSQILGSSYKTIHGCEGQRVTLQCNNNEFIHVNQAWYGVKKSEPSNCAPKTNKRCHATGVTKAVQNICQHKKICSLHASNTIFGDPCRGVKKVLSVEARCEPIARLVAEATKILVKHKKTWVKRPFMTNVVRRGGSHSTLRVAQTACAKSTTTECLGVYATKAHATSTVRFSLLFKGNRNERIGCRKWKKICVTGIWSYQTLRCPNKLPKPQKGYECHWEFHTPDCIFHCVRKACGFRRCSENSCVRFEKLGNKCVEIPISKFKKI